MVLVFLCKLAQGCVGMASPKHPPEVSSYEIFATVSATYRTFCRAVMEIELYHASEPFEHRPPGKLLDKKLDPARIKPNAQLRPHRFGISHKLGNTDILTHALQQTIGDMENQLSACSTNMAIGKMRSLV